MDQWIDLARGPLFRLALSVMVLGLGYRVAVTLANMTTAWLRAGDRRLPWSDIASATLTWLLPVKLLRTRPMYSAASFVFHIGVVLVPLFLLGHAALLDGWLPRAWPVLPAALADDLTVVALAALGMLMVGRVASASARALSRPRDIFLLGFVFTVLLAGFLAGHPGLSPFSARSMLLVHIACGDLLLILIPTTKIAHCAIYPFTQLLFQLGWHFPAESGRHVAQVLAKEEESV